MIKLPIIMLWLIAILFNGCGGSDNPNSLNISSPKPSIQSHIDPNNTKNTSNTQENQKSNLNKNSDKNTTKNNTPSKNNPSTSKDTTPPTITLLGTNPQTIEFGSRYKELGAKVKDNKDANPTLTIDPSLLNTHKLGEYQVIYLAKDSADNEAKAIRVVKVIDTTTPTIILFGDKNITLELGQKYKELGFKAIDNVDGNITKNVIVTNNIVPKLGTYKIIYSVKDNSGNEAIASRVVQVVDITPPVIKLYGSSKVTLQLKEKYQEAGAEAIDNVDGNISSKIKIIGKVDTSKAQEYTLVYSVADSSGNEANVTRVVTVFDPYSYIPKELNDYMAIRFLNKATFGATKESIKELQELGVEAWIDKQFSIPETKDIYIRNMIELSKLKSSRYTHSVEEYLEDNDIVYFQGSQWERMSSWFQSAINAKDQLRHKTAYNLSQIIVESDFEPLFKTRAEVLARYFDILYSNAFKSYKDVLKDITFSSGMGIFLTYRGSRAEYNNSAGVSVYPDENYAREIMQLFTIGLNELNIDGTLQGGKATPTYTQEDVNELARVFTGWDVPRNSWKFDTNTFGRKLHLFGDLIHPMVFFKEYHDKGEKKVLGHTIPAGMDGRDEILLVLDILMNNKNTAPYISKNLIMRFTKSNPSPEYVARVATVFKETNGDLKAVIKAILLDPEIWEDIKDKKIVKFKEPFIGYTNFLRAFNVKPLPYWYTVKPDENASNTRIIYNRYHFDGDTLRANITQAPGLAPNVFNFYDNDYIPNDENFKALNLVAPELQIQSDSHYISFSNYIKSMLVRWDKNYITNFYWPKDDGSRTYYNSVEEFIDAAKTNHMYLYIPLWYGRKVKILLDTTEELAVMEEAIDGDSDGDFKNITKESSKAPKAVEAVIKHLDRKLTGGRMNEAQFNALYNNLKDAKLYGDDVHTKRYKALTEVIYPAIRAIVTSSLFMTE